MHPARRPRHDLRKHPAPSRRAYTAGLGGLLLLILVLVPAAGATPAPESCVLQLTDTRYQHLETFYKDLHQYPELSGSEVNTSRKIAGELRDAGFTVTERVGGYGVVGVLRNGDGPVLGLRGDMDALPITEKTGLPYASTVTTVFENMTSTGVMHACGHDSHSTVLVGTARQLADSRGCWNGTLVIIAQPAEESATGARAMIDDGLFTRFPVPEYLVGIHSLSAPPGTLVVGRGLFMSGKTTQEVTIRGYGGHGGTPQRAIDPVVIAADAISSLQTLKSREYPPDNPVSITVGSIHAGNRENIIPEEVRLKIDIRATTQKEHMQIVGDVRRVIDSVARAHAVPDNLMPIYAEPEYVPPVTTDPALADRITGTLTRTIGPENVSVFSRQLTISEDFSWYGLTPEKIPTGFFFFGGPINDTRPETPERFRIPPGHNPRYAIDPGPSIRTAVRGLTAVSLDLLAPQSPRLDPGGGDRGTAGIPPGNTTFAGQGAGQGPSPAPVPFPAAATLAGLAGAGILAARKMGR